MVKGESGVKGDVLAMTLEAAYRTTRFVAMVGRREVVVRVGQRSSEVERLMARHKSATAAFITADNPNSRPLGRMENCIRRRQFRVALRARRLATLPGAGHGVDGNWAPEESPLIFGISENTAAALGRAFQQNAIVFIRRGHPARLVWLDPARRR